MASTNPSFPRRRQATALSLGAAALAAALAGCTGPEMLATTALVATVSSGPSFLPVADYNDGLTSPKAPLANPVRHVHQVQFQTGDESLGATEAELLDRFVRRLAPRYGNHLFIEAGGGGNGVGARRADLVAAYLSRQGYRAAIHSSDERPVSRNAVNVVVASHMVTLPGCPDWTAEPGNTFSNQPHSNWGCATASNLGMMVADPGHLNEGAPYRPLDGEQSVLAIQRYRKGEVRELSPEDVGVTQAQQKNGEDG